LDTLDLELGSRPREDIMNKTVKSRTSPGKLWEARKGLGGLLFLSIMVLSLVATVPGAWATPSQHPLRQTVPPPTAIAGTVFNDLNGDGSQQEGEPGIEGVTVTLDPGEPSEDTSITDLVLSLIATVPGAWATPSQQPLRQTVPPQTAITDEEGNYWFPGLEADSAHTVEETDPAGYISTTPNTVEVTMPSDGSGVDVSFGDRFRYRILLLQVFKGYTP